MNSNPFYTLLGAITIALFLSPVLGGQASGRQKPKIVPATPTPKPSATATTAPSVVADSGHSRRRLTGALVKPLSQAELKQQFLKNLTLLKVIPGGSGSSMQVRDKLLAKQSQVVIGISKEVLSGGQMFDGNDSLTVYDGDVYPHADGINAPFHVFVSFSGTNEVANGQVELIINSLKQNKMYVLDIAIPGNTQSLQVDTFTGEGGPNSNTPMPVTSGHLLIPVLMTWHGYLDVTLSNKSDWQFQSVTIDPVN